MHPNMPQTGEQIICLSISSGILTAHNKGTVRERERFSLTDDEFTTTHGSRHDCARLHPMSEKLVAYLERFPTSQMFIYCREQDKAAAWEVLKAAYVAECDSAAAQLRERANQLQRFSFEVFKL